MRRLSTLLILVLALLLGACGFQLRGAYALPFATLHVPLPESSELHALIKRHVEATSATRVLPNAAECEARLLITLNNQAKNVLSLNAAGRVREYELVRQFQFRVVDKRENELVPPSQIMIRRDITFSDEQVLSKEAEEALLWRDMQTDLVQQLLRRLAAAKKPA
jgi:LPS-assembly lipoprotein